MVSLIYHKGAKISNLACSELAAAAENVENNLETFNTIIAQVAAVARQLDWAITDESFPETYSLIDVPALRRYNEKCQNVMIKAIGAQQAQGGGV